MTFRFAALAALLFGAALFFFRGTLESADEVQMALTAQSLAERGSMTWEREAYGRRFSGYGAGMPLAGVPLYALESAARARGWIVDGGISLLPLAGAVLFAVSGALCALVLGGMASRSGNPGPPGILPVALALLASPMLPASASFYSENLAAAGLLAVAAGAARRRGWIACAGGLAAMLARSAMLPLLLLAAVWAWRRGSRREAAAALAGIVAGAALNAWQSLALFGSLKGGYAGQDFTSPAAVGLFGLIASPERGLLVFWPLGLLPLVAWRRLAPAAREWAVLAAACLGFSLAFHAVFWTWHGGWTSGPRFLLPALALLVPPTAAALGCWRDLGPRMRWFAIAAGLWSAFMAWAYASHSAVAWWNALWGHHQEENSWLFFPQLSLWFAVLSGWGELAAAPLRPVSMALGGLLAAVGAATLFSAERPRPDLRFLRLPAAGLAAGSIALGAIALLRGPRGWTNDAGERLPILALKEPGVWQGIVDQPLASAIHFSATANARYRVEIDGTPLFEQTADIPQHLPRATADLAPGPHEVRVDAAAKADGAFKFNLFWNWGGGAVWQAPAGGEYVLPRLLTPREQLFTALWRKRTILNAAALALVLLWTLARQPEAGGNPA